MLAVTFLHPWALGFGAAAAVLPVLIHWLTRPRPVRLPLSTIRFVQEAVRQKRARHRLRDWLILGLRVLAVLLLAGALARPQRGGQPVVSPGEPGDAARVVIVDASQSMAAQVNGIQAFERARPVAARYLADRDGLQANLILAAANPRPVFERLSTNFVALRDELAQVQVRPERLNAQAAINAAAELLAKTSVEPGRRRELIIISDFQRSNWTAVDFSPLPQDARIELESVAPAEALPNLAVLRVGYQGRPEQGRDIRLEVDVGNFSSAPRRVQVDLALGTATYRLDELCPAGVKTTLSSDIVLPAAGWYAGEARLVDVQDSLPADDVRPFVLEIRPPPSYALITRQPAEQRPSSSYYLERALMPSTPRSGRAEGRVVRLDPGSLDRDLLAAAEVIVVDHPGRMTAETVQLLATFVRRGRGLLYVAAEPIDATNLKSLAEAAGADLQLPVEFMPPPPTQRRRDLFLAETRRDQAPFSVFGDSLPNVVAPLRFSGGLTSRRVEGALADDILATYSDRSACLVISSSGAGTLAVLNADLAVSNLAASPAFVPLVAELLGRLHGRQQSTEGSPCGEPIAVYLPPSAGVAGGLTIVGPMSGGSGELVDESSGVLWRSPGLAAPAAYRVKRGDATVFALAATIPPDESDLRSLEPSVLQGRLAGGRTVHFRSADSGDDVHDDNWVWLAGACALGLLGEFLALKAFRT